MKKTRTLRIFAVAASLAVVGLFTAGTAVAAGDAAEGEKVYKKRCVACHTLEEGKNRVGPSLHGIFGRQAGLAPKYKYSKSYVSAGENGLEWTTETLLEYLADPKKYMREITGNKKAKSKMTFKLKKKEDREHVAAYLESLQ